MAGLIRRLVRVERAASLAESVQKPNSHHPSDGAGGKADGNKASDSLRSALDRPVRRPSHADPEAATRLHQVRGSEAPKIVRWVHGIEALHGAVRHAGERIGDRAFQERGIPDGVPSLLQADRRRNADEPGHDEVRSRADPEPEALRLVDPSQAPPRLVPAVLLPVVVVPLLVVIVVDDWEED